MNVVHVKPGVRFDLITPGAVRMLGALDAVARIVGVDLTITSGTDSHPPTDVHARGLAYDVSVAGLTVDQILDIRHQLQVELGAGFTVLYESAVTPADARLQVIVYLDPHATAPHFHVQVKNGTVYPPIAAPATVPA